MTENKVRVGELFSSAVEGIVEEIARLEPAVRTQEEAGAVLVARTKGHLADVRQYRDHLADTRRQCLARLQTVANQSKSNEKKMCDMQ